MRSTRIYLLRQTIRTSLWIVPLLYLAATLVVGFIVPRVDRDVTFSIYGRPDPNSVRDVLSAIATGMMAFTGFVLAIVLLLVQFGSAQFGPRVIRWARQDWVLKNALGFFVATFVYAIIALSLVGRGDDPNFVPDLTFTLALILLVTSLVLFFFLLDRISTVMRPAAVGLSVSKKAREILVVVFPDLDDGEATQPWTPPAEASVREVVLRRTFGASLVTIAHDEIMKYAKDTSSVVELVPAIGEHVRRGVPLFRVYGGDPRDLRRLEKSVVLSDERNMDDDPSFAFRLLVDVAIKALSPAINDPTTAVQVLDWLGGLLRDASERKLGEGVRRDEEGRVRVVYRSSTWEDLVALSFEEILFYGRTSIQVCRRLEALLKGLVEDLPPHRRPAIVELRHRLELSIQQAFPLEGTRTTARDGDRLGLGMAGSDGLA